MHHLFLHVPGHRIINPRYIAVLLQMTFLFVCAFVLYIY